MTLTHIDRDHLAHAFDAEESLEEDDGACEDFFVW
jgi:hypothetical protein